jgi:mono/diheme cytochrome c family protein
MPPERDLKSWLNGRPGVFNPGAPMLTLQVEDVPNLSIPQIWGISGFEQEYLSGRAAPLGQTTKYASLEKFVASAFVYAYQDLSLVRPRHVQPLVAYLRRLKAPINLEEQDPQTVRRGAQLFEQNCVSCHNGATGESTRLFSSQTVGTHPSLESPRDNYVATTPIAKLVDDLSRQLAAELQPQPRGIRSRRLAGVWARKNLMIDGSVEDLSDLFCVGAERVRLNTPHQDLCSAFSRIQREELLTYLKTL